MISISEYISAEYPAIRVRTHTHTKCIADAESEFYKIDRPLLAAAAFFVYISFHSAGVFCKTDYLRNGCGGGQAVAPHSTVHTTDWLTTLPFY